MIKVLPCGDGALLAEVDNAAQVAGLYASLRADPLPGQLDLVPAARTVLVRLAGDLDAAASMLAGREVAPIAPADGALVQIPVRYDGPDLDEVAARCGRTSAEVVERHAAAVYRVAFCGFAPGFGYLTGLDPALRVPRLDTPRPRVPAGSVAIAGEYAAVYPRESPGGWQLIGHTGLALWDLARTPPALLTPGTRVRFVPA